jgi:RNA polymerase sigma-70 factor (ECF subfamily)
MESADDLVLRARTDRDAFGRLYDLYYPNVFRYCLRRLIVRAVAEDLTSEVFLRVAAHMRDFPDSTEEGFRRWLYRVATNEVNAFLRRTKRHRALLESAVQNQTIRLVDNENASEGKVDHLDWPAIQEAILTLKPREQTVLIHRFSEQMSYDEIAGVLKLQPATVRVVLSRAMENLRVRLGVDSQRSTTKPEGC